MGSATATTFWILDMCTACQRTVYMDLLEQVCPECLNDRGA